MAGGYESPATGQFGELTARLKDVQRRLDVLERPTGTQSAELVANQVRVGLGFGAQSGFAVSTSLTTRGEDEVVVPAGFSRALVSCTAILNVLNGSGSQVSIEVWGSVSPAGSGNPGRSWVRPGEFASVVSSYSVLLDDLAGGDVITVGARVAAGGAIPASGFNTASSMAIVLFQRG